LPQTNPDGGIEMWKKTGAKACLFFCFLSTCQAGLRQ